MRPSVRIFTRILVCTTVVVLASACGPTPPPPPAPVPPPPVPQPFRPVADVKQLMQAVVDPSADVVWDSVATTITKAGMQERAPRTEAEWANLRMHAMMLAESGNLLMMPSRARDSGPWMAMARALVEKSEVALRAAETKDIDALYDIGGEIDTACENCHKQYWPDY